MELMLFWIIMGIICGVVAQQKGRNFFAWFFLGVLFSIISLIVLIFLPNLENEKNTKPCPFCKETIKIDATMCKHCKSVFNGGAN